MICERCFFIFISRNGVIVKIRTKSTAFLYFNDGFVVQKRVPYIKERNEMMLHFGWNRHYTFAR